MSPLFQDARLGNLILANRCVRSATWEGMCDAEGNATPKLESYYATLARGDVGLIISGYAFVRADGRQLPGKMGIDSDERIPALKRLVAAVHDNGGRVFCQLVHAGGQTGSKAAGTHPLAPSAIKADGYPETPREMTPEDIAAVVAAFGDAARRAREAGFDGVQLHGAHGYLVNQFLSPLTNRRSDAYGGTLANRMRFLEEVAAAVRDQVNRDYPVTIKLTASDNQPGGFVLDEAIEVARRLEQLGIDAIEVSSGTSASGAESPVRQNIDSEEKEAYNADFAAAIKQEVEVPVMVVGGIRSRSVAERILNGNQADFIALSRPLIREPNLPRLWQADPQHRARCISCNGCFKPGLKEGGIYCVVDRIEAKNRNLAL